MSLNENENIISEIQRSLKKKNPKKQVCITYLNSLYDSDNPYHDLGRWNIQQAFPK